MLTWYRQTSLYCTWQTLRFCGGNWRSVATLRRARLLAPFFSYSICLPRVSASHFGNSHSISNPSPAKRWQLVEGSDDDGLHFFFFFLAIKYFLRYVHCFLDIMLCTLNRWQDSINITVTGTRKPKIGVTQFTAVISLLWWVVWNQTCIVPKVCLCSSGTPKDPRWGKRASWPPMGAFFHPATLVGSAEFHFSKGKWRPILSCVFGFGTCYSFT